MAIDEGSSSFIILYHRTPFDEGKSADGKRIWMDQKSPYGIIPTLRNLFRSTNDGTWIAWRRVDEPDNVEDERITMDFLSYCDGKNSLLDIADKIKSPCWELFEVVEILLKEKLITRTSN